MGWDGPDGIDEARWEREMAKPPDYIDMTPDEVIAAEKSAIAEANHRGTPKVDPTLEDAIKALAHCAYSFDKSLKSVDSASIFGTAWMIATDDLRQLREALQAWRVGGDAASACDMAVVVCDRMRPCRPGENGYHTTEDTLRFWEITREYIEALCAHEDSES